MTTSQEDLQLLKDVAWNLRYAADGGELNSLDQITLHRQADALELLALRLDIDQRDDEA
jgi:hypothetical protein